MAIMSPNPSLQDLKVTYHESTLVSPSKETEKRSFFLSNIDQFLNFDVSTIRFFPANLEFPPEVVAKRMRMALEKVLVQYDFVAGRLRWDPESARFEIDCNDAGAGFVVASSELSLDELGDFACPNSGFRQLAVRNLDNLALEDDGQPLCTIQVTSFKCGGFAIGLSNNHILLDGLASKTFQENLASQAFGDDRPLPFPPCHDRHLLAARSPPLITFPHPEFYRPELPLLGPLDLVSKQELDSKIFKLGSKDINFLKAKAHAETNNTKITTFNVVAALIWRCRALASCDVSGDKDRVSTLLNALDLRSRVDPPLPREFCGNAILPAHSSATCRDIEELAFAKLVEMVSEGIANVTDEYAKSVIDFIEVYKGVPYGDIIVTSWLRLGFEEVAFPWGKPVYCGPLAKDMEFICWLFPGIDGVSFLIQRPPLEMERFQYHFNNFFGHN